MSPVNYEHNNFLGKLVIPFFSDFYYKPIIKKIV